VKRANTAATPKKKQAAPKRPRQAANAGGTFKVPPLPKPKTKRTPTRNPTAKTKVTAPKAPKAPKTPTVRVQPTAAKKMTVDPPSSQLSSPVVAVPAVGAAQNIVTPAASQLTHASVLHTANTLAHAEILAGMSKTGAKARYPPASTATYSSRTDEPIDLSV
jgi:hypothetical protein